MINQYFANIKNNKKLSDNIYRLSFECPEIAKNSLPGQFVNIRCSSDFKPLLRRPFSIQNVEKNVVSILYKVIGEGTKKLSSYSTKDKIDVLGPLGNNFSIPDDKKIFMVAGGAGIAPLSFLIHFIVEKKVKLLDNIEIIWGAKNSSEIVLTNEFKQKEINLYVSTEDGSVGEKGTCISLFKKLLDNTENKNCVVYAGGPLSMLKEISFICKKKNIRAQIAYENIMACGVGSCLGCVINTKKGPLRVCKDGPVFDSDIIDWE